MLDQAQEWIENALVDREWLGLDATEWVVGLVVWVGVTFALYSVHRLLAWRLAAFAARTDTFVDDLLAEAFKRTRLYFLTALALYLAVQSPCRCRRVLRRWCTGSGASPFWPFCFR